MSRHAARVVRMCARVVMNIAGLRFAWPLRVCGPYWPMLGAVSAVETEVRLGISSSVSPSCPEGKPLVGVRIVAPRVAKLKPWRTSKSGTRRPATPWRAG